MLRTPIARKQAVFDGTGFVGRVGMSADSVRWTLWNAGRSISCIEHLEPGWLEVRVTYDSLPLATTRCDQLDEALRWSDQIRAKWEAFGWTREPAAAERRLAS